MFISSHLTLNQTTDVKTQMMHVNYQKNNISDINSLLSLSDAQINLPSFCGLLANTNNSCQSGVAIQKVCIFLNFTT